MDRHGFVEEESENRSRSIGRRNLRAKLREQLKGYSNVRGEACASSIYTVVWPFDDRRATSRHLTKAEAVMDSRVAMYEHLHGDGPEGMPAIASDLIRCKMI